jgi:imidazolonepropionase
LRFPDRLSIYVYTLSGFGEEARRSTAMTIPHVRIWRNARIATLDPRMPGLGEIEHGAIVADGDRIVFVGPEDDLPSHGSSAAAEVIDAEQRWITPGLIDCHTHLVYGGNRAHEFELRLAGATYEEIARAGGGIVSSVRSLRETSEDELLRQTLPRLDALIAEGVTTIEVKSGYGLDLENERKSLRVARRLGNERAVNVQTTFLGAHALPPEAHGDTSAYIDLIVHEMLPAIAAEGLADAVDGFCEGIAFSPEEIARVFTAAQEHSLPVKLHADQLSNLHGAELAASFRALSADHLEHSDDAGAAAMAKSGTVAVLLPGAFYFLHETNKPPVASFRKHGTSIAIATDSNPGTSPLTSLLLTMNMAATLFGLTVEDCIAGITREAARALGKLGEVGTLEAGKRADFAIWDIARPAELVYRMGYNPLHQRVFGGTT